MTRGVYTREPWSAAECELMRALYSTTPTAELATQLGRPIGKVYAKAAHMGLKKAQQFLATSKNGRILRGGTRGQQKQFAPGHVPWNKGTNYVAGGRSAETRFKHGMKPHGTLPLGSYRITPDKSLEMKTGDTIGATHRRWTPVARLVWIAANGPIPPGCVVVFKPGRHTTVLEQITPDAIELLTRVQLIARNSIHQYPPELQAAMRAVGKLRKAINDHADSK